MTATTIVRFNETEATDHTLVGGKAANLGMLTQAGFDVPSGFAVTTTTYEEFLRATGLEQTIRNLLENVSFDDSEALETTSKKIRSAITTTAMPAALSDSMLKAYASLGSEVYVAVRSSGTAEDLAGASFAGLHDTYLDVKGESDLIDAIRSCWASLWAARAVHYRQTRKFDHFQCPIAVVVQLMIESEVSGVMFTANPLSGATDELVLNSSWGLGEAIVGGITTPDQFTLQHGDLRILERKLGGKKVQIVRDAAGGRGTKTLEVPQALQESFSLTDEKLVELAALGRKVQAHYGSFPQDIEWALAKGKFYLLQSRPITGIDFSWDADVTLSIPGPTMQGHEVWGRGWADEAWTGAVTPLMFSWRARAWSISQDHTLTVHYNFPELQSSNMRLLCYYKSEVYYNLHMEKGVAEKTCPPAFRALSGALSRLPRSWRAETAAAKFDYWECARTYARIHLLMPQEGVTFYKAVQSEYIEKRAAEFDGLSPAQLQLLGDRELEHYIRNFVVKEATWYFNLWTPIMYLYRDMMGLMSHMISAWYDGPNESLLTDILSGSPESTITKVENKELWELAHQIRQSPTLLKAFHQHEGASFFTAASSVEDGPEFISAYQGFVQRHGHRGHSDRDIYFFRRVEDPAVDYRFFMALLGVGEGIDPDELERSTNRRRDAAIAEAMTI